MPLPPTCKLSKTNFNFRYILKNSLNFPSKSTGLSLVPLLHSYVLTDSSTKFISRAP